MSMLTPVGYNRFRLANAEFVCAMAPEGSTPSVFSVHLAPATVAAFGGLRDSLLFARVLQASRRDGSAAALTMLVGAPSKLVVVSEAGDDPDALAAFAERRGWASSVRSYTGVSADASDRWRTIVDDEFPERSLDVMLDDGSNWLVPGLALFDEVFPALGDGGRYLFLG